MRQTAAADPLAAVAPVARLLRSGLAVAGEARATIDWAWLAAERRFDELWMRYGEPYVGDLFLLVAARDAFKPVPKRYAAPSAELFQGQFGLSAPESLVPFAVQAEARAQVDAARREWLGDAAAEKLAREEFGLRQAMDAVAPQEYDEAERAAERAAEAGESEAGAAAAAAAAAVAGDVAEDVVLENKEVTDADLDAWERNMQAKSEAMAAAAATGADPLAVEKARFIEANDEATGMVAVGVVTDHAAGDETALALSDNTKTFIGRTGARLAGMVKRGADEAKARVQRSIEESDSELVKHSLLAAEEVRSTMTSVRSKVLPESETALAIGVVQQRLPDFDLDDFCEYLERDLMPKVLDAMTRDDLALLGMYCTDAQMSMVRAGARQRKADKHVQVGQVLDVKRIELHEATLEGSDPLLRFVFTSHQTLAVYDADNELVEGSEHEVQAVIYDLVLKPNDAGPTDYLTEGWIVARCQPVQKYTMI